MAAIVNIIERNGAGATWTTKDSGTVRFKNANDFAVDAANPLVIPTGATNEWSFEKWLRLRIGTTPPSDNISNVKFYTDGVNNFGAGIQVWARSANAFSTPAELTTATGLTTAFALTVGGALQLSNGSTHSGSSTEIASFVVPSMEVSNAATVGALTPETVTFSYDEI